MDKLLQDWFDEDLLKRIWRMVATQDTCDNNNVNQIVTKNANLKFTNYVDDSSPVISSSISFVL